MAPIARHCQANWHTVGHRINPRQKAGQQRPEDSYNEIPERTKSRFLLVIWPEIQPANILTRGLLQIQALTAEPIARSRPHDWGSVEPCAAWVVFSTLWRPGRTGNHSRRRGVAGFGFDQGSYQRSVILDQISLDFNLLIS
jgi:hypothetical protein